MIATLIVSLVLAVLLLVFPALIWRYWKKTLPARITLLLLVVISLPALSLSFYILYFSLLAPGQNFRLELSPGVQYSTTVLDTSSQHAVVHVVHADLRRIELRVSPPQRIGTQVQYVAKKTSSALEEFDADLAVNASFFFPFRDIHIFDFYPHVGDTVSPVGQTLSEGILFGRNREGWPKLVIGPYDYVDISADDLETRLSENTSENEHPRYAVSGKQYLIKDGIVSIEENPKTYPRLAIGLNADKTELWIFVVDGKQPGYSDGLSLSELSAFMLEQGVYDAIELDGGGSATLAIKDADGKAKLLNRPSHTKIPGRERPVANHLLMYFKD